MDPAAEGKQKSPTTEASNGAGIEHETSSETKDDLTGSHSFLVNGARFIVDAKYSPLKPLGHGAYGVVCSALDRVRNKKVAIKKIPKAFTDLVDAKRMLREAKLLRHFSHQNIVGLRDLIPPMDGIPFEDLYYVMDFMETDLHKIIYSTNELSDDHIQYFIYQLLRGLKYVHSANVIHRDLKPSNLLLNGNCDLKICDFGLARGIKEDVDYELTEYVVTRYYRAPEVMCCCQQYDQKIDVWSVGCIMAELHGRKPLFPGEDYLEQMNLIFGVLGTPSEDDMKFISNEKAVEYIRSLPKRPKIPFGELYKHATPLAADLMDKMLQFDLNKRITVEEALAHPYLAALHNPETEKVAAAPFNFEFEKVELDKDRLQQLMWKEIYHYRRGLKKQHKERERTAKKGAAKKGKKKADPSAE